MSTFSVPAIATGLDLINASHQVLRRLPQIVEQPDGSQVWTYSPDLTTEESATLDLMIAAARASANLSGPDITAIRAQMQTLRALRQLGRNSFMALSQAERDRTIYDALVAVTQIFIAELRDGS
jgi:hypothetical protein